MTSPHAVGWNLWPEPKGLLFWAIVDCETEDGKSLMRSPFPGMDPYIENCGLWGDFHHRLISEIQDTLAQVAPDRFLMRAGE